MRHRNGFEIEGYLVHIPKDSLITMKDFRERVIEVVRKIPKGKTLSYKEVARRAGNALAARAVGTIMNRYGGMEHGIPCHRVVRSDGTIGGYRSGPKRKEALLRKEGAT